jgi:excisionase family DNA binding protein
MKDPVLLTPSAAARMLGKSEHTVKFYVVTGKLPCLKTTTGRRLFRQSDVEEFMRKGRGEKGTAENGR